MIKADIKTMTKGEAIEHVRATFKGHDAFLSVAIAFMAAITDFEELNECTKDVRRSIGNYFQISIYTKGYGFTSLYYNEPGTDETGGPRYRVTTREKDIVESYDWTA